MLKVITAVFKYSCLVLVILVLSHIIEIKGVTISRHVENSLNWIGGFSPKKIGRSISGELQEGYQKVERIADENLIKTRPLDTKPQEDVSAADQQQLNQVIHRAKSK